MAVTAKSSDAQREATGHLTEKRIVARQHAISVATSANWRSRRVTEAETAFKRLYSWMRRCRLGPMKKAGKTLMAHKDKIMAYFRDHITNAISEGINSLIHQTTKSRPPDADGFSSVALLATY